MQSVENWMGSVLSVWDEGTQLFHANNVDL